jgi:hypothetical protein
MQAPHAATKRVGGFWGLFRWHLKSSRLSGRNTLRLGWLGLSSGRLSASKPSRSAVPLAAAGIVCLGLVPTLGGPDLPLHWAVTAGMVGFGVLLWVRRRLRGPEPALQPVPQKAARQAAQALSIIVGVVTVLVGVIFGARLHSGGSISALSFALPAGLCWLALLSFQVWRYREPGNEATATGDRPSRRPSSWDSLSTPRSSRPPPDRHVSA